MRECHRQWTLTRMYDMDRVRNDDLASFPELFEGMEQFFAQESAELLRKSALTLLGTLAAWATFGLLISHLG